MTQYVRQGSIVGEIDQLPSIPTVVDDRRESIGVCNGKVAQVLGAHVASMTKPDSRQTRAVDYLQDERTAAGFPQH